MAENHDRNN